MNGKALKLVRQYHRLNLTEGAEKLCLSKSFVSELENNKKKISIDILNKYSETFNIPVSSFMLFSEMAERDRLPETVRFFAVEKVTRMLEWIHDSSNVED